MFRYRRYFRQNKTNTISAPEVRKKQSCLSRDLIVAVPKNKCFELADITFYKSYK